MQAFFNTLLKKVFQLQLQSEKISNPKNSLHPLEFI